MKNGIFEKSFWLLVAAVIVALLWGAHTIGVRSAVERDETVIALRAEIATERGAKAELERLLQRSAQWIDASARARRAEMQTTAMWRQVAINSGFGQAPSFPWGTMLLALGCLALGWAGRSFLVPIRRQFRRSSAAPNTRKRGIPIFLKFGGNPKSN